MHRATLTVALATLAMILFVDRPVTIYVSDHLKPGLVAFFNALTEVGNSSVYIAASALFWLGFHWLAGQDFAEETKQRFAQGAEHGAFALAALLSAGAVLVFLKFLLGRMHPSMLLNDGAYGFAPLAFDLDAISLPSGHTHLIWSVTTIFLLLKPRVGLLLVPVAVLVGISRIAVNMHFVSDVILGAYIGVLVPLLVYVTFLRPPLPGARAARPRAPLLRFRPLGSVPIKGIPAGAGL